MKMLKRLIAFTAALVFAAVLFPATASAAEDPEWEDDWTNADGFVFVGSAEGVSIVDYVGKDGDIVIPDKEKEWPVTDIDYSAFAGKNLGTVTFGKNLKDISFGAFLGSPVTKYIVDPDNAAFSAGPDGVLLNKAGTKLVLYPAGRAEGAYTVPEGVTEIAHDAFAHAAALASCTLPAGLKLIGSGAFDYCANLTGIALPAGVAFFSGSPFYMCTGLESITVDAANATLASQDGVLFDKALTTLWQYPAKKADTAYAVPGTVVNLGDGCFAGSANLKEIALPAGIQEVVGDHFADCAKLEAFTLPAANPKYKVQDGVLFDTSMKQIVAYPANRPGQTYTIPSTVSTVGQSAFYKSRNLTGVTIPKGTRLIKSSAFRGCGQLASITIPDRVTSIRTRAFADCTALKKVKIGKRLHNLEDNVFSGCTGLQEISVPKNIYYIPEGTFAGCTGLQKVKLTYYITYFQADAFTGCGPGLTIVAPQYSMAIEYAKYIGLKYAYSGKTPAYKVKVTLNNKDYGSISGLSKKYYYGQNVALKAVPAKGCYFKAWKDKRGSTLDREYEYVKEVTKALTIKAYFEKIGTPVIKSAASLGGGSVKITWKGLKKAYYMWQYYVYRAEGDSGDYTRIGYTGETEYTDTGLTAGKKYSYKVQAAYHTRVGPLSKPKTVTAS